MQIKMTILSHIPVRIVYVKVSGNCWQVDGRKGNLIHYMLEMMSGSASMETSVEISQKIKSIAPCMAQ